MNNKKLQVWFPVFIAVSMVVGMFLGYKLRDKMPWSSGMFQMSGAGQVQEVMDLVSTRYVDSVKVDSLQEEAIDAVLNRLDPHSVYIPAKRLQGVNEDLAGRFEGIGVEFNIFNDTVHIISVLRGGPSDKVGLVAGDRIIAVEQKSVAGNGITGDKIRSLLRGPRASKVNITVLRDAKSLPFTIIRGFIPLYALDAAYMLNGKTGYIRLNKFSETAYEEFMEALEKLKGKGMTKLVLDLRENGGGILDEAVEMADEFLAGDKLIVYTEGVNHPRRNYTCKRRGLFEDGELVLLINEGSASASEVLAGALQEWDRATIIGRRSFGKGLVQEQYNLSDGAALRLTVARYYTPLGRSIQKPYNNGVSEYNDEILDRYHRGELYAEDSSKTPTGKAFKTPKGKLVYGGGGITPDIFVAFDTTAIDSSITQLYQRNTLGKFVYNYYVQNRKQFDQYRDATDFAVRFTVTDEMYNQFLQYAGKDSVILGSLKTRDQAFLRQRLKSLSARQIWRTEGFYEVTNADDPVIRRAMDLPR